MSVSSGFSSSGLSSSFSAAATLPGLATPALGKGAKAAREFEAQLIGTVLSRWRKPSLRFPGRMRWLAGTTTTTSGQRRWHRRSRLGEASESRS